MLKDTLKLFNGFFKKIITRKNPEDMIKKAAEAGLEKTLTAVDLIMLGIGAIIGSGIFAVVGIAAAANNGGAGPALVISMIIATIACIFSALCYSEFATMIPVAGGAYTYTFATLGEFAAWMVGWVLMLEYVVGYIAVACAWSNHFMQFVKGFEAFLPNWLVNPPAWLISDYNSLIASGYAESAVPTIAGIHFCINLPALIIVAIISAILIKGTKDSTKMTTIMVFIKLAVIALFVFAGAFYVRPENWGVGVGWSGFAPNGMSGIFKSAFLIFFAYIGFDALATTAEECKNPQKDLPIGIVGSLLATTVVYISVALVLTGMYCTTGHIDEGFLDAPMAFVMTLKNLNWVAGLISIGSLAGLTSVLLVLQLAATRILYAMSRDNFLPRVFQKLHSKFKTPHVLTTLVGVVCVVGTLTLDLEKAAQLCNFGTFASFIIICIAVLILRKIDPDRPRPFKVPCSPLFPILGIVCCGGLMICSLKDMVQSSSLFLIWLAIGVIIYLQYGYIKNRKAEIHSTEKDIINEQKEYITK